MITASSTPVARPLPLNTARRAPAIPKNPTMATRKARRRNPSGVVRALVNPRTRGTWLAAASGQMLRHRPGATKKVIGSSGTITPKKTNRPPAGRTKSATHSAR